MLGEIFRRAKVTNFLLGDENFARQIVSPNENFARHSFARLDTRFSKCERVKVQMIYNCVMTAHYLSKIQRIQLESFRRFLETESSGGIDFVKFEIFSVDYA